MYTSGEAKLLVSASVFTVIKIYLARFLEASSSCLSLIHVIFLCGALGKDQ